MIRIVAVGRIKEKSLQNLLNEYLKRLQNYHKVSIEEVDDYPTSDQIGENDRVRNLEGEKILSKIREDEFVILLDLNGKELDSIEFSKKLEEIQTYQSNKMVFVIGGSVGVSENVKKRANYKLKLSEMTFPHQLARLLIVEQIYRAYKIIKNEPYHK